MLGADTVLSAILRLVTTVVVLGAVYLFIVKPVLKTTNDVVHQTSRQTRQAQRASDRAELSGARQRARSYAQSVVAGSEPWFPASHAIRRCIDAAGTSLPKMNHCANVGEAIVTGALSARNFAISYASSLDAQGSSAEADRVRHCVAAAGFKVRPMIRCKALATRYLYG
jgi:hypothetical protein